MKAVGAARVETEPLVFPTLYAEVHQPAVTRDAVVVEVTAVPPKNVEVFPAPKVRRVVISDVAVQTTVICRSQRVGGVIVRDGIAMAAARRTIGQPVLVHVEPVRKPTTVEHRAHAVTNVAHTGLRAVRPPSPELPHTTV